MEKTEEIRKKQEEINKKQEIKKEQERISEFTGRYVLLEKTKILYTIFHPKLNLFPKSEKFTLRQRIEELILDSIKLLIKQNYKNENYEKRKLILDYLANMELLLCLVQQASIFKYISLDFKNNIDRLLKELISIGTARYKNLKEVKNETI
jgi:hypothetical protein